MHHHITFMPDWYGMHSSLKNTIICPKIVGKHLFNMVHYSEHTVYTLYSTTNNYYNKKKIVSVYIFRICKID